MTTDLAQPMLPPQDLDAEQAVLGAILLNPSMLATAQELLTPETFYRTAHRQIFGAMLTLAGRQEPIDLLTLNDELSRQGQLEAVGGASAIAELLLVVGSATNLRHHAKLVAEKATLRAIIAIGSELVSQAYEASQPAAELLETAERALFRLSQGASTGVFRSLGEIVRDGADHLEALSKREAELTGVASGLLELDDLTAGWQPSDLIILAGRPSMGKTSLALGMALHAAMVHQVPVGIFSLEMSSRQLGLRLLSMEARLDSRVLRHGRLNHLEWQRAAGTWTRLESLPIWIDDSGYLTLAQLRARARRLKAQHACGLLIVDYLQLLAGRPGAESRQQEITEASRLLKLLAKELDIPVLALSQLSRACEARQDKRPMLADLRESGSIEQDADLVLFIYRHEVYEPQTEDRGIAELLLRKHRNGPTGDKRVVFLERFAKFENLETRQGSLL